MPHVKAMIINLDVLRMIEEMITEELPRDMNDSEADGVPDATGAASNGDSTNNTALVESDTRAIHASLPDSGTFSYDFIDPGFLYSTFGDISEDGILPDFPGSLNDFASLYE